MFLSYSNPTGVYIQNDNDVFISTPTTIQHSKWSSNYAKKVNYKEKNPLGQSLVSQGKTSSFQKPIKFGKEGNIIKRQELLQYQV